jgi:hypothetical protein
MWTGSGYYSVLAWSTVVLESVPEEEMTALRSRGRGASAAGAAIARKGGPLTPTPEQQRAERVSWDAYKDLQCSPVVRSIGSSAKRGGAGAPSSL